MAQDEDEKKQKIAVKSWYNTLNHVKNSDFIKKIQCYEQKIELVLKI